MAGLNKVTLIGHLGADPEVRHLEGGKSVANFSLATTESYKNKDGERVDSTEWHRLVIWGNLVKVVEKYVKKGSKIYVEGKIRQRSYEDKEGVTKYITEILVNNLLMLDSKPQSQGAQSAEELHEEYATNQANGNNENLDDLPF